MTRPSQQPYLLRALYAWCIDAGYTPYINARIDPSTRIPPGYARNNEITLNIGPDAVQALQMENDWISFTARFGGVAQSVEIPAVNILAIYARETGEGMSFAGLMDDTEEQPAAAPEATEDSGQSAAGAKTPKAPPKGKPDLRLVK